MDLISREAVMSVINRHKCDTSEIILGVLDLPTIDAVPVVHGNYTLAFSEEENVWKCSNCGDYWLLNDGTPFDNEMNFCPKCGARMDGKKNEEVPVIVVRCKNCKHWGMGIAGETDRIKCCMYARYMVGENGYCVYGEKEGAE